MLAALAARFAFTDGMRAFLGTWGKPLLFALLLAIAVLVIDQRGFNRAKEQDRVRDLERREITREVVAAIDAELDAKLAATAALVAGKIQSIDTEGKTVVQPIITRELLRDRSLADPNRCLSPGLLSAVNAARGYLDERLAGGSNDTGSANPATVPGSPAPH